jgi:colanic acid biosynthesis glycosyl transferase WcaI
MRPPKVTVLYHYFYPDDVVSARHFADFCQGLAARGWQVEAMPCNRACRNARQTYSRRESWGGITIRRVWRPRLRQATTVGRLLNAAWMILAWSFLLVFRRRKNLPDVLVVGTDPPLSVLAAWVVKRLRPSVRVAHWCYDLFPEAPIAEGMLRENSVSTRLVKRLFGVAYRSCDLLADLGCCMRRHLQRYPASRRQITLVPWALSEPATVAAADPVTRRELFGEATLGLLYSGNFGRAHSYKEFLELARCLRGEPIHFCFGVRGNQAAELRAAVRPEDRNVSFAGFAPESALERRLGAADIHLVSTSPSYTGVVVPSKFFGSLAAGRPVLFAGSRDSAIAHWIREHQVGWVLDGETLPQMAQELRRLAKDTRELQVLNQRCRAVYLNHFSLEKTMNQWDGELRALLQIHGRSAGSNPSTHETAMQQLGSNGSPSCGKAPTSCHSNIEKTQELTTF